MNYGNYRSGGASGSGYGGASGSGYGNRRLRRSASPNEGQELDLDLSLGANYQHEVQELDLNLSLGGNYQHEVQELDLNLSLGGNYQHEVQELDLNLSLGGNYQPQVDNQQQVNTTLSLERASENYGSGDGEQIIRTSTFPLTLFQIKSKLIHWHPIGFGSVQQWLNHALLSHTTFSDIKAGTTKMSLHQGLVLYGSFIIKQAQDENGVSNQPVSKEDLQAIDLTPELFNNIETMTEILGSKEIMTVDDYHDDIELYRNKISSCRLNFFDILSEKYKKKFQS